MSSSQQKAQQDVAHDHPDGGQSRAGFWRSNRGIALALLALTVALGASIWFSDWAREETRDGFILGGFPLIGVALMALSLLVMIFDGQSRGVTTDLAALRLFGLFAVLATLAFLGLTYLAFAVIGFVPAITLLVAGGSVLLGFRPAWIGCLVGLGTASFMRLILFALGVNVADGLLINLLGG